jgi:oligoribonuclease
LRYYRRIAFIPPPGPSTSEIADAVVELDLPAATPPSNDPAATPPSNDPAGGPPDIDSAVEPETG